MNDVEPARPSGAIPGSGRKGTPRALDHMYSVRFDARTLKNARLAAEADGVTLSEWIRDLAKRELGRRITAAINVGPAEIDRLRQARQSARADYEFYQDPDHLLPAGPARRRAARRRIAGWGCVHMNMTSIPGILTSFTGSCGCDMQPVYETA